MSSIEHEHIGRGIALRVVSALSFSVMSALFKLASEGGIVAPEMLFYRALFGLPVILLWVMRGPGLAALTTRRPLAHVWRSALGMASILCTFQALILLPLADATTIAFTAPVFATILSWLILREQVGRHRWMAVLVGFAGVAIVVRPGESGLALPLAGVAIGLVAALGTAGVTITVRQMRGEHVAAIVFWFFAASALVGLALLPAFGSLHDGTTMLLMGAGAVAGALGQITMTASLRYAPVSAVSPFDYLQIIGAVILGWLLLASEPGLNTLAGAAVIAGSGLYIAWRQQRRNRCAP